MASKQQQHDKEFKLNAVKYVEEHPDLTIESFHSLIKRERLNRFRIANFDAAYTLVWEYIEAFYNTVRIHSHDNFMSPNEYERMYDDVVSKNAKVAS